jgi:hypothetical protein
MSDNGSNTGLGLDKLILGDTSKAFEIPKAQPEPPVVEEIKTEEPIVPDEGDVDLLKKPFTISNASARPVEVQPEGTKIPAPKETKDASSPFASFANVLKEQGIFFDEITEDLNFDSIDDFTKGIENAIKYNVDQRRNEDLSRYTPETREFIDMLDKGVDFNTVKEVAKKANIKDFVPHKLEDNVDLQKQAIKMYLSESTDMSEQDIEDQIEYFEDTSKLSDKANSYATKLQDNYVSTKERLKQEADVARQQYSDSAKAQIEGLKEKVYSTNEIVPGKPLNDNTKEKLFKSITTAVSKDPNTGAPMNAVAVKRQKDPVSFEIKLHYLNELGVFDDKWDGLISSAKSQAVKDLEKALSTSAPTSGRSPVYSPEEGNKTSKDILASFNQLKQDLNKR